MCIRDSLWIHLFEDGFGAFIGKLGEEIGGRGGIHLLDNAGGGFRIKRLHQGFLKLGLDFLEGFGSHFLVEGTQDCFAFGGSEIFEDRCV